MKALVHTLGRVCVTVWICFLIINQTESALGDTDMESYHCMTSLDQGTINWTNGTVTVTGKAAPIINPDNIHEADPGAARADANRRLIEILKQITIYNDLTVGQFAAGNDDIMAGIEKTARDAVIIRQYYTSALDVELTVRTRLLGGFLQLVLPDEIRQIPKINPDILSETPKESGKIPYTGLILDVRKLDFDPVLYPVIVSEQGGTIYSAVFISREFAVQHGVCKYMCAMDNALQDPRVGSHPLVIKGLRTSGKENTAIVISTADAKQIEQSTERHLFLKQCRVIFVTGN
ncbi:hypothetical protein [Desulfotignum phosphitoxidans]|jgi:hypothetical protein|uniref:Uncharacterized protein n=1 Tax=Desulfotignum phosphitoxidans DSM 13687 TaxID=1286635 RepID=S0FUI1_9BACT|nr:hypothetical protein [Desulfotignum phosphitoxidans]EMS78360.1 hypothetical protein Dpo_8c00270 [Desulfotignum phosphitoxidans DSM 13687]